MNHEIIDLAKQFRLSVLHDGTFPIEEQHREYLLRLLQTEAAKREERSLMKATDSLTVNKSLTTNMGDFCLP